MTKLPEVTDVKHELPETAATLAYSLDILPGRTVWGQHKLPAGEDLRSHLALRLSESSTLTKLPARFSVHEGAGISEIERNLARLSHSGVLRNATIVFGVLSDPFHPFAGKFDGSLKLLELLNRYRPGRVVLQTRSPLLVIGMPMLKKLGDILQVSIGIETTSELVAQRYTPDLPRVSERLKAARALRKFGIEVTATAAPLLPYGDWRKDAAQVAEQFAEIADRVHILPLSDGTPRAQRQNRSCPVARALAADRQFFWMRPDAAQPVMDALQAFAPEKLAAPSFPQEAQRQLALFG